MLDNSVNRFFERTEIIENYQFNVKSLLDVRIVNLINCVISHSLTDEILGATSFDETTRTICKCIEENFISQNK